ncbi:hypothetical protein U1Q18_022430, partial [Sarracenia purpurea var. burkii]
MDNDGESVDDEENYEEEDGSGEEEGFATGDSVISVPVDDGDDDAKTEDGSVSIEIVPDPPPLLGDEVISSGYNDRNVDVHCQLIDEVSVGIDPCVNHKDKQMGATGGCRTHAHHVLDLLLERTPIHNSTKGSARHLLESCLPTGATIDVKPEVQFVVQNSATPVDQ